jgi:hypothetical protein
MEKGLVALLAPAALGILLMIYVRIYLERMSAMGKDLPRRVVARMLGEEADPEEVEDELLGLRRRLRFYGLAALALSLLLAATFIALVLLFRPYGAFFLLPGLAVLALSLGMSSLALGRAIA